MATAELAIALVGLSVVVQFLLTGTGIVATQLQVADAARISVRLAARGESNDVITRAVRQVAPRATVQVSRTGGVVEATVEEPPPGPLAVRLVHAVTARASSVDETTASDLGVLP